MFSFKKMEVLDLFSLLPIVPMSRFQIKKLGNLNGFATYIYLEANEIPNGYVFVLNDTAKLKELKLNEQIDFTIDNVNFQFIVTGTYTLSTHVIALEIISIIGKNMEENNYNIFSKKKSSEVISELIKGAEVNCIADAKQDFIMQFKESNWNFIKRLAYNAQSSISCQLDGKVKVGKIEGKKQTNLNEEIIVTYQRKKLGVKTISYDKKNPQKPVIQKAGNETNMEIFYQDNINMPAKYLQEQQKEILQLISCNTRILPYDQVNTLFVNKAEHFYGFDNVCRAELSNSININYREPSIPLLRAMVCNPQNEEKPYIENNSIFVKLYIDEKEQKIPATLIQQAASNNANSFRCLQKNEEVIVNYVDGTLFIIGSLFNSINKHNYSAEEYAMSYGKENEANKISINYGENKKTAITLQGQLDFIIGKTSISIKEDDIKIKCKNISIETTNDIIMQSTNNFNCNAANINLKANVDTQINTMKFTLASQASVIINALDFAVSAKVGIKMMSQVSAMIQAGMIDLTSNIKLSLTSVAIMINGSASILMNGGVLSTMLPVMLMGGAICSNGIFKTGIMF